MRSHNMIILLTITLLTSFIIQFTRAQSKFPDSISNDKNRRILHQPLFPADSAPPPLPPPPPTTPDSPDQDHPFSGELPTGPPELDQGRQQPPPGAALASPVNPQPSKPTKKVAIAITSAILTLGMLSGLAFFLYKNRVKDHNESRNLVGRDSRQRINEESRMPPPSAFLCIETPEASTTSLVNETNISANASPYLKLRSDRYRPSPDIQPLPPLTKPTLPPPAINSPPPMSSSDDDESHDTSFFTRQGKSTSNNSPINHFAGSVPHSRRTSPKSRFSASSPDAKALIIPSIKLSLPPSPPLHPSKTLPYTPKRMNFSPSPDTEKNRFIGNNNEHQISKITIPQPPPPPPPLFLPRRYTPLPVSRILTRPKSKSPSPKESPVAQKTRPVEEINNAGSSEKFDTEDKDGSRPKMKPLHWDKVRDTSDRGTVWDQLKSSSFQLNEDAIDSLFGRNSVNSVPREATRKFVFPSFEKENRILDTKKSQNIAILLRALNVTREEVSEALLDGNPEGLGPELFETLVKMAPSKEEEIKLKNCNDKSSKLGPAERFLKTILNIPFAFKRVEAMLYRANFDTEVKYLRKSFHTLEEASEELKNSRLFLKLLEAVLRTGNRMNDGTNRGDAKAFKLDTLLKLVDIKGTDGKTTLLHFVVQEIIRSEGAREDLPHKSNLKYNKEDFNKQGLQVVSGLGKELGNVKKAAGMDSDVLNSYVSKLETGLQKVKQVMQYENQSREGKFFDSMKVFITEAADEISRIKAEERKALSLVKEVTQYFHGEAAKQEAHPLRIFMVIRDFLSVLDNVCKDVGRMQDRATMGSGRSFRISAAAPLPVLNRCNLRDDTSSDDDSV